MEIPRHFSSDNWAGAHPKILEAMAAANHGHARAYGYDAWTKAAVDKFREQFGDVDVYFVFNGTAANVLSLKTAVRSFNSVICANTSHLNTNECGAPENFLGCKLVTVPSRHGKIRINDIAHVLNTTNEHQSFTKAVSITQATELGTVYQPDELAEIADYAHGNGMLLHMDGTRLCNAAASLKKPLRDLTAKAGVDVLSFGGTKNGLVFGDAVVLFNKKLSREFKFIRKQGMQLCSKMRFLTAQFQALFTDDLWLKNAEHSNHMAQLLHKAVKPILGVKVVERVETNAVFAAIPPKAINLLQKKYSFHVWDARESVVRWMTAFDTTPEDIQAFARHLTSVLGRRGS